MTSTTVDLGRNIPAHKPLPVGAATVEKNHEEYVWIELDDRDNIPKDGQFIQHNGRAWKLKPGVPALVPRVLLNVLNDAIESYPVLDPATDQVIGYRDRPAHPYRFVAAPADASE